MATGCFMTIKTKRQRWTPISIIAIILGFIVWWPLGLGILAYILWGGSVDKEITKEARRFTERSSGNAAFDEYRARTLEKLQEEQEAFGEFLERLRKARDKEEFDRFMAERNGQPA